MQLLQRCFDLGDDRRKFTELDERGRIVGLLLEVVEYTEGWKYLVVLVKSAGLAPRTHELIATLTPLLEADVGPNNVV